MNINSYVYVCVLSLSRHNELGVCCVSVCEVYDSIVSYMCILRVKYMFLCEVLYSMKSSVYAMC